MANKKTAAAKPTVKITKNGPYIVSNVDKITEQVIVTDREGASDTYQTVREFKQPSQPCALCRCGHTKNHPFCDGSHVAAGFDGTTTASKEPILKGVKAYKGDRYTLLDNEKYCAFARFCDASGRVWNLILSKTLASEENALAIAHKCPAGRLIIQENETQEIIEPSLGVEISVLEDPAINASGPLYLKGGVTIIDENNIPYERRNRETVCRCGLSSNKPFCDGSHASAHFNDGDIKPRKIKSDV